jgi:hypothetical protein
LADAIAHDHVRAIGDVVQHLQHVPLTSESDAELVNNPLQCGCRCRARLLGGFSPKLLELRWKSAMLLNVLHVVLV